MSEEFYHGRLPNIHPGEILRTDFLDELGLRHDELSQMTCLTTAQVSDIAAGKLNITPEIAKSLGKALKTSAELWIGLQADYDKEEKARAAPGS